MIIDIMALVIAAAALIISVISPVLNSHFRIKEKKLDFENKAKDREHEFYVVHRAEVIEKFLKTAGKAIEGLKPQYFAEFGDACAEIYLYLDELYWKDIDAIIEHIESQDFESAFSELREFAKKVSKENIRQLNVL